MRKYEVIHRLVEAKIVAIVRTNNTEEAIKVAKACYQGGIGALEITYSVPRADKVISKLREQFTDDQLLVGAGTVLDSETAFNAYQAGARYIVAPNFSSTTASICNRYQIPYIPGCMTITEIVKAMEAGVEIVKLFPASEYTPSIIKAIRGPLPQALLMPTGGINLNNVAEWYAAGSTMLGVGGNLTKATNGNYTEITNNCQAFLAAINKLDN